MTAKNILAKFCRLMAPAIVVLFASNAWCEEPVRSKVLERKATGLGAGRAEVELKAKPIYEQIDSLSTVFDVFISREIHPQSVAKYNQTIKGNSGASDRRVWKVSGIQVTRDTTLRAALQVFEQNTGGAYEYRDIANQICLVPRDPAGSLALPLDLPVSFTCENLTAEAAFGEVVSAFNSRHSEQVIKTQTNAEMYVMRMPTPYYEEKSVSLNLENVPMREALCQVMGAAPIRMYYIHHSKDERSGLSTHLLILCTNYKMPGEMVKPEFRAVGK